MPVSYEDVRNAYRFILGRDPESEAVVLAQSETHQTVADLRHSFLKSPEFQSQGFGEVGPFVAFEPLADVEVDADPETVRTILARIASFWTKLGEAEPYWAMNAGENFLLSQWSRNKSAFYKSGDAERDLVLALLRRAGRPAEHIRRVVEFGCGVGRSTIPLARAFAHVTALDISPTCLELAQGYARAEGLGNVEFRLSTPDDVVPSGACDLLFFSPGVLAHNPPPVVGAILREGFRRLEPDGLAIVMLPTYIKGYAFHLSDYLARSAAEQRTLDGWLTRGMDDADVAREVVRLGERHATPAPFVLRTARDQNCWLIDVQEEPGHPNEILHVFTFGKG